MSDYNPVQRKRDDGFIYQHTLAGENICGNCRFRTIRNDYCRRFRKNIRRVGQWNGGFHHKPCKDCLNHKITELDLTFMFGKLYKKYANKEQQ